MAATAHTLKKAQGIHFTPAPLAQLLVKEALKHVRSCPHLRVLDPACGDGELLLAVARALPPLETRLSLTGYETNAAAATQARDRIAAAGFVPDIRCADFLNAQNRESLFETDAERFDLVVSNPPYVRTQVMGAELARLLAKRFGLTGRVDLYHAFAVAMTPRLVDGGVLALLTSNRFMFTRAGLRMRQLLRTSYALRTVVDFGDTKLFSAAVLPCLVIAVRATQAPADGSETEFVKSYSVVQVQADRVSQYSSILEPIGNRTPGLAAVGDEMFLIEVGTLAGSPDDKRPWSLRGAGSADIWLQTVRCNTYKKFGDVSIIRVGIKTTADTVFIRDDWSELPDQEQPESELLRPLITRRAITTFSVPPERTGSTKVLYPYGVDPSGRRQLLPLERFERAARYLERHRERLEARTYVAKAGRAWYEIWVAQQPRAWRLPKLVFPDISEQPLFAMDTSGAVVNGDCYWLSLRPGQSRDWLWLILAVANSSLVPRYYDAVMNNKLYSRRRRFITQYVAEFPLPQLDCDGAKEAVAIVQELASRAVELGSNSEKRALDRAVDRAFGLSEELGRNWDLDLPVHDLALKSSEEREELGPSGYDDVT
jgi:SAM-dependent methyltransferase